MEDTPAPESDSRERGVREGYSDAKILLLPAPRCTRLRLFGYRRQRSHVEFFRAIREALNREASLREQSGHPDEWLRQTADWVVRGALPK
jgi:hypothetical protein